MAEMALVGSGPNMYQVWLGGHPAPSQRTAEAVPSLFQMKLDDLEKTFEPIFAMHVTYSLYVLTYLLTYVRTYLLTYLLTLTACGRYKTQRVAVDEAFGTFCHRVTIPAIEEYMASYEAGSYK